MKNKTAFIADFICVTLLVSGLLWCIASSFNIVVNAFALNISTVIFSLVISILSALEINAKKFWLSVAAISAVFFWTLMFISDTILSQLSYALSKILGVYSQYMPVAQGVKIGGTVSYEATVLFVFLSAFLSAVFSVFLIKIKLIFPVSLISIIILVPSFILVNTLPSILSLFTVIAVLFTLFITSNFHRYNHAQSGAATAVISLITLAVLLIVYVFNPMDGYERQQWQDDMLDNAKNFAKSIVNKNNNKLLNNFSFLNNIFDDIQYLSEIGPQEMTGVKVLKLKTGFDGDIYLKGMAYADYNDNKWSVLSDSQASSFPLNAMPFTMTKNILQGSTEISIITNYNQKYLFTPYFLSSLPENSSVKGDVCITNESNSLKYTLNYIPFNKNQIFYCDSEDNEKYKNFVYNTYLQLPEDTKTQLLKIAEQNGLTNLDNKKYIPESVKNFVSQNGYYSLDTPAMPDGADFPIWFLNESDKGYCVHYATAAATMLRALGVPARYVTGYYVTAHSGQWTTVTSDNAHAWVEYYDENIGWIPLEATPPSFSAAQSTSSTENNATQITTAETQTAQADVQIFSTQSTASTQSAVRETISEKPAQNKKGSAFDSWQIIILITILIAAAILTFELRRSIILNIRTKHFSKGHNNKRAVYIYRYIEILRKYSHVPVTKEIENIAAKAKFSNHTVDDDEIKKLISCAKTIADEIYNSCSLFKKLYFKFIIVLK